MFDDLRPHLVELRKRLALSVASVLVMFMIAFSFHEPLLAWITKPLKDALTQVGLVIESKQASHWKIQQNDANGTEKNATIPTVSIDSIPSATTVAINSTQTLHTTLQQASDLATAKEDKQMASLLQDAANAAEQTSEAISKLSVFLSDTNASTHNGTEKSFGGMVTTHQLGGVFFVALKVSFFAALLSALPFILYQLWLFVSPGLYANEKKMIIPFVVGGSMMFMVGVMFAYYVVTPFGFQFLIAFGAFLYTPLINIEDYIGFFTKIMTGFGIAFELPVFTYFLALLGMITDKTLKDFFKYAVVIIFILAAILTPPDVLTQILMAIPLIMLYGISILIVRMVNPHIEEEEEEIPAPVKDA